MEGYRLDPFANYIARVQTATATTSISPPTQETERYRYQAGTGRLLERRSTEIVRPRGERETYDGREMGSVVP